MLPIKNSLSENILFPTIETEADARFLAEMLGANGIENPTSNVTLHPVDMLCDITKL